MSDVISLPSVYHIKDRLLNIIFSNQEHSIFKNLDVGLDRELQETFSTIRLDLCFPTKESPNCFSDFKHNNKKFNYYYRLIINLANKASVGNVTKSNDTIWLSLINSEFNRVNCLVALVAWLTIDDWRWHKEFPQYNIPEDLNYGLVLNEPLAVISFAQYILGYKRDLDKTIIDQIQIDLKEYLSIK